MRTIGTPAQGSPAPLRGRKYRITELRWQGKDLVLHLETATDRIGRMFDGRLVFREVASTTLEKRSPDPWNGPTVNWEPVTIAAGKLVGWTVTELDVADDTAVMAVDEMREEGPVQSGFNRVAITCDAVAFSRRFAVRRSLLAVLLTWPVLLGAMMILVAVCAKLIQSPIGRQLFDMLSATVSVS